MILSFILFYFFHCVSQRTQSFNWTQTYCVSTAIPPPPSTKGSFHCLRIALTPLIPRPVCGADGDQSGATMTTTMMRGGTECNSSEQNMHIHVKEICSNST